MDYSNENSKIAVLGMGYVGLPLAVLMANLGFKVLGVEIRDDVLDKLKRGETYFFEPGLKEQLRQAIKENNLSFSKHISDDFQADVYIITVGTPLDDKGQVRLDMIKNVSEEISNNLKQGNLVILRSTVKIGTTRKIVMPILEKAGVNFDLGFCPERILEGQALTELRKLPQIVGGKDSRSCVRAAQLFQFLTPTVVKVSSIETAEIIKLIDNVSRDVSFGLANEVARICDVFNIRAAEVIRAGNLGYDRNNLPMPGPVGGPCLSKDPYILAESLEGFGLKPEIAIVARKVNEKQPEQAIKYSAGFTKKLDGFPEAPIISLLGISFKGKPLTDDLRGTMAKPIFEALKRHFPKASFQGFDPMVAKENIEEFGLKAISNIEEIIKGSDIVLILNNNPLFANMAIEELSFLLNKPAVIYDFWNNFTDRKLHLADKVKYIALGSHKKNG